MKLRIDDEDNELLDIRMAIEGLSSKLGEIHMTLTSHCNGMDRLLMTLRHIHGEMKISNEIRKGV